MTHSHPHSSKRVRNCLRHYFEHVWADVFEQKKNLKKCFEHVGTDVFEIMKITVSKAFGGVRVGVSHNY